VVESTAYPETAVFVASLAAVVGLAVVHLFSGRLPHEGVAPRSSWLSFAGGVSVAYVFVHLLPELQEHQEVVAHALGDRLAFLEHHIYLVALVGLAVYYGVERLTAGSREREREAGRADVTSALVFWLDMAAFGVYNVLIGYLLLHRIGTIGLRTVLLFALAMALHFWVNDVGLRERHKRDYTRIGRRVLAIAVVLGWALGALFEIPEVAISVVTAFLAGGLVLNVLTEELPEARQSQFSAFALGAGVYAALLLAL
jgi:zinc transporter ZupT